MDVTVGVGHCLIVMAMTLSGFPAYTECQPSCAQLEFDKLETTDTNVTVTQNSKVILTFYLVPDTCTKVPENFVVTVISTSSNLTSNNSTVCSFILEKQKCTVEQRGPAVCRCRSQRKGILQFRKKMNQSEDESYLWSWMQSKSPSTEMHRKIRFVVTSVGPDTEIRVSCLFLSVGVVSTFASGVVVTIGISACILKCQRGRQRLGQLVQNKPKVTSYKALDSCSGAVELSTEDSLYEDVVEYENETPFTSVKLVCL